MTVTPEVGGRDKRILSWRPAWTTLVSSILAWALCQDPVFLLGLLTQKRKRKNCGEVGITVSKLGGSPVDP